MEIYRFTTTATHPCHGKDTIIEYLAAYGYEHAKQHIKGRLTQAGWKIISSEGKSVFVEDIRDSCDHITD